MTPLRIAIAGAGHMGTRHAEKVSQLAREGDPVVLAGIADTHPERAVGLAARHGAPSATDAHALFTGADAVIVAVPTSSHFEIVRDALLAGKDVLVEKPIASTLEQGEELLRLAEQGARILQVGHLEWFNGAMQVMREQIDRPLFVESHRIGPFPARSTDIDVVRDLMIHDLDILQQILDETPSQIDAVGIPVLSGEIDIANARLVFPGGCVANLTASRVSPSPMRRTRFFQRDGYCAIDFLEPAVTVVRRRIGEDGAPKIEMEKLEVDPRDALLTQLRAFVRAVRTREKPTVDGANGLGALRSAIRVVESMPEVDGR